MPPDWLTAARALLDRIAATQADAIEAASVACAEAIGSDRLVHLFGTGHSRIPLEEMFPRYGSFPGFHPIAELSMTFHTQVVGANGQRQAMFIEQVPGLAAAIIANFDIRAPDVMMIFSASGTNAVPIEMACAARERGLTVIAVTSVAQSLATEPRHPSGRLLEHADITLDLCTPANDALVPIDGDIAVGPGSTIAAVALANAVKCRTAELLAARGTLPPVIEPAATAGQERSARSFDAAYADHARRVSRLLR